jgi:hypothetical protein
LCQAAIDAHEGEMRAVDSKLDQIADVVEEVARVSNSYSFQVSVDSMWFVKLPDHSGAKLMQAASNDASRGSEWIVGRCV